MGVGMKGRGSGGLSASQGNTGWLEACKLGAGYIHCGSSEQKKKIPNIPVTSLSLLYLNPTIRFLATPWKLLALSCHRWAESKSR